jgi:hypothetical protein
MIPCSSKKMVNANVSSVEFSFQGESYRLKIADHFTDIQSDWQTAQPADNVFLQGDYLRFLEQYPLEDIQPFYAVIYRSDRPFGVFYFQSMDYQPGKVVGTSLAKDLPKVIRQVGRKVEQTVLDWMNFQLLICGNVLLTGSHGFYVDSTELEGTDPGFLAEEIVVRMQHWLPQLFDHQVNGFFLKDLPADSTFKPKVSDARAFNFLPNFFLDLSSEWNDFSHYLGALTSKYRVRARRAFRLAETLARRELNLAQIKAWNERIYELYREVVGEADYNMAFIPKDYFLGLKETFGSDFRLVGYFQGEELVGFYTTLKNGKELEAHFLGFPADLNRDKQIYLNMLFDIIRDGIRLKAHRVIFARTASEIKSSVGAQAENLAGYICHHRDCSNRIIGWAIDRYNQDEPWKPRHPFKAESGAA